MVSATPTAPGRDVLDAARAISRESGPDAISIKALTARSGVSNGSIYHHFESREGVIAALVLDAFADYQRGVIELLDVAEDAEGGIKGLIVHHLEWVEANPDDARLLMARRDEVAAGTYGRKLAGQNREFLGAVGDWLEAQAAAGRMPAIGIDLAHALAIAPAQEIGALWLAGRITDDPMTFADRLAQAGWAAVVAVPT